MGFNASIAILKGIKKSRANVFKCGEKTRNTIEEEPQQTCSICGQNTKNSLDF